MYRSHIMDAMMFTEDVRVFQMEHKSQMAGLGAAGHEASLLNVDRKSALGAWIYMYITL